MLFYAVYFFFYCGQAERINPIFLSLKQLFVHEFLIWVSLTDLHGNQHIVVDF